MPGPTRKSIDGVSGMTTSSEDDRTSNKQKANRVNTELCALRRPCPALGYGWSFMQVIRQHGKLTGKCDTYYYSSAGHRVRSKLRLQQLVDQDLTNFDYHSGQFVHDQNNIRGCKNSISISEKHTSGSNSDSMDDLNIVAKGSTLNGRSSQAKPAKIKRKSQSGKRKRSFPNSSKSDAPQRYYSVENSIVGVAVKGSRHTVSDRNGVKVDATPNVKGAENCNGSDALISPSRLKRKPKNNLELRAVVIAKKLTNYESISKSFTNNGTGTKLKVKGERDGPDSSETSVRGSPWPMRISGNKLEKVPTTAEDVPQNILNCGDEKREELITSSEPPVFSLADSHLYTPPIQKIKVEETMQDQMIPYFNSYDDHPSNMNRSAKYESSNCVSTEESTDFFPIISNIYSKVPKIPIQNSELTNSETDTAGFPVKQKRVKIRMNPDPENFDSPYALFRHEALTHASGVVTDCEDMDGLISCAWSFLSSECKQEFAEAVLSDRRNQQAQNSGHPSPNTLSGAPAIS